MDTLSTNIYRIELRTIKKGLDMELLGLIHHWLSEHEFIRRLIYLIAAIQTAVWIYEFFVKKKDKVKVIIETETKIQTVLPLTAFKRLLTACLGDRAKANSLISYELKKDENLDKESAAEKAIERLSKDRQ